MSDYSKFFADPDWVERYQRQGPAAFAPGYAGLLQMTGVLLSERTPTDGAVLIVGAGGGAETKVLAEQEKGWRFVGVDPSPDMLELARRVAGPSAGDRLTLVEGVVFDAPPGPFDAATCILVLGLIPDDGGKLSTLKAIRQRLIPGGTFILVDQCLDRNADDFPLRLDRYAAFARASGVDADVVAGARESLKNNATIASRSRNQALLDEAGFTDVEVFYQGMAWIGWVACA